MPPVNVSHGTGVSENEEEPDDWYAPKIVRLAENTELTRRWQGTRESSAQAVPVREKPTMGLGVRFCPANFRRRAE